MASLQACRGEHANKAKTAEMIRPSHSSTRQHSELSGTRQVKYLQWRHQKKIYNAAKTSKALTLQQPGPANTFTQRTSHTSEAPECQYRPRRAAESGLCLRLHCQSNGSMALGKEVSSSTVPRAFCSPKGLQEPEQSAGSQQFQRGNKAKIPFLAH